ncbi:hypothetical protein D3C72_2359390 [compost metagenome]
MLAHFQQHTLERNFLDPQAGTQAQLVFQRYRRFEGQAPWTYHRAFFIDVRCAQLQLQGMELVLDQVQGKGHLMVVELRL